MQTAKVKYSIKHKLIMLSLAVGVPFLVMSLYLVYALHNYSSAYDAIVENLTVANNYNLNFKEEMDESLYKLVVGAVTFDTVGSDGSLADPYVLLNELRGEFSNLMSITTDGESRARLQILLRNIDTLEDRVDDIRTNLEADVGYDTNIVMLEDNIYILTELIQDNIQYYIYYQTKSMEHLTSQLNVRVHTFTLFCGAMLAFLIFMVAILIIMIVTDTTRPIKELSKVTEQVAKGDFSARARAESQDEVAVLADSVNSMTESLEGLVSKIKEDERKMRKADLRLLQEQINPHFLYNTLDTIVWLIEGNDSDKAVNMVMSLSEFFRLVLSKGKEYITIQEEELHIRSYLEIQQVRYRDILEYEIRIDPELYRYQILKLTLQPLVENSLYHGIKYKRARGNILVTGRVCGDEVHFTVEDNGVGMEEEELRKLQEEIKKPCKDTEKGFGLANVNERIRMNFGTEYGMQIDSARGEGTRVEVVIPAVPYTEERED
ncbi:MAG: sensor histidine kinase [Lachnospiraceae bacterium]|nr:sensor histidine kinase [Lachnospiraceae bacterium]